MIIGFVYVLPLIPLNVFPTEPPPPPLSPYHWAMIAGAAIQASAQTAARVISKTLTDRYLKHANSTYFEPRGLKAGLI